MAALPYIQLYVADYLADAAHLNAAQHGAYLLLIFNYWQKGHALNNSNERLASVARMSNDEWEQNRAIVAEFFRIDGDTWHHDRIDADLAAVADKSTKASRAGKASADNRAANVQQSFNERSTNAERTFNHTDTDTDTYTDTYTKQEQRADARPTKKRGTRLPPDWSPDAELAAWVSTEKPGFPMTSELAKFRDYWAAKAGAGGVKLDWSATFRNWVRNANTGNQHANLQSGRKLSAVEQVEQAIRNRRQREADNEDGATAAIGYG